MRSQIEQRCSEGILRQGHAWKCPRCLHKNWLSVDRLTQAPRCEVCKYQTRLPAEFSWHFRIDGFTAHGLRECGLLGLVWALGQLNNNAREFFAFAPPLELYRPDHGETPWGEVDIACVCDGIFTIGEVKEAGRDFNVAVVDALGDIALEVRPDRVLLACLERAEEAAVMAQVVRLSERLVGHGIEVQGMLPDGAFGLFEGF